MPRAKIIKEKKEPDKSDKTIAALSYFWILCLWPLFTRKDSDFIQFHARQGFVMFLIELGASLVVWFPIFGQLFMLLLLAVAIIAAAKAYNGEEWKIPYVNEWSEKIDL